MADLVEDEHGGEPCQPLPRPNSRWKGWAGVVRVKGGAGSEVEYFMPRARGRGSARRVGGEAAEEDRCGDAGGYEEEF